MTLGIQPTSASPRFGGVNIKYKYTSPARNGDPTFIDTITYEVVPDSVFKGVRSESVTTHLEEAPSTTADQLTKLGQTADPRSTDSAALRSSDAATLYSLLDQATNDAGFFPSYLYAYTKLLLAYGLNAKDSKPVYEAKQISYPSQEGGEAKPTWKPHTIATFTIQNPFLKRDGAEVICSQLPKPHEIESLRIFQWRNAGDKRVADMVLPEHLRRPAATTS